MEFESTGIFIYPNETVLNANGSWIVSEVLVKNGDEVKKGQLLCKFDMRIFNIERQSIELEIMRLQNALDTLDDWNPYSAVERRAKIRQQNELSASIVLAKAQLDFILTGAPPETGLQAPISGTVHGISVKQGDMLRNGFAILTILPDEKPELFFTLPPMDGAIFGPGSQVQAIVETLVVSVSFNEGENKYEEEKLFFRRTVMGHVISGVLRGGVWECRAILNDFEGAPVIGQEVPIKTTQQGEIQDFIVPIQCIFTIGDSGNTTVIYRIGSRPGLFGEENYLTEIEVSVLYSNDRFAALEGNGLGLFMEVAGDPTRLIKRGDVVFVRNR